MRRSTLRFHFTLCLSGFIRERVTAVQAPEGEDLISEVGLFRADDGRQGAHVLEHLALNVQSIDDLYMSQDMLSFGGRNWSTGLAQLAGRRRPTASSRPRVSGEETLTQKQAASRALVQTPRGRDSDRRSGTRRHAGALQLGIGITLESERTVHAVAERFGVSVGGTCDATEQAGLGCNVGCRCNGGQVCYPRRYYEPSAQAEVDVGSCGPPPEAVMGVVITCSIVVGGLVLAIRRTNVHEPKARSFDRLEVKQQLLDALPISLEQCNDILQHFYGDGSRARRREQRSRLRELREYRAYYSIELVPSCLQGWAAA